MINMINLIRFKKRNIPPQMLATIEEIENYYNQLMSQNELIKIIIYNKFFLIYNE